MTTLVVVPARGGSKGLPGKNLRCAGGLTLTARAVLAGRRFLAAAGLDAAALVLDTDDGSIAEEGRRFGAEIPFLREAELARDDTPTAASILRCIDRLAEAGRSFDSVILLQPTSPLRTPSDIGACWRLYDPLTCPSVVAIAPLRHAVELAVRVDEGGRLGWITAPGGAALRRQDVAAAYGITGAVYVTSVAVLRGKGAFVVPGLSRGVVLPLERSVDVDSAADLQAADAWLRSVAAAPAPVTVAGRSIGAGAPCYVIAEAGVNHNGSAELAHRLVDAAADARADAVKFQTFDPDRLASPAAPQAGYQAANSGAVEPQVEMLRRLVLPADVYAQLKAHAERRGLTFLSSPFDEGSADFLEALDVAAFKIPSGEITNLPFLAHVARKGKPMLVSTGMSTMAEVAEAALTIAAHGDPPVALFHCVSNYPARADECNLSAIATMRAALGVPVGWSDHTDGVDISVGAVALGADLLEKHFTLDRDLPGPDHKASLEPAELTRLVASLRQLEAARGLGEKVAAARERETAAVVRKSLHARRPLAAGDVLTAEDLIALRPADGFPPSALGQLVGRRVRCDIPLGTRLEERHLE